VTGRTRTDISGTTNRGSALELRPRLSAHVKELVSVARIERATSCFVVNEAHSIRSRVPAPPNRCGRFPPAKRELHAGFCSNKSHFGCVHTRAPRQASVSRCTVPGIDLGPGVDARPCTSRAAHTRLRTAECMGTAEVRRSASLIEGSPSALRAGRDAGQCRRMSCGKLLKSCGSGESLPCADAQGGSSKTKGPVPFGNRASGCQSVKGVRLGASLSRWWRGFAAIKPRIAQLHGNAADRKCGDTGERMQVALGASLRVAVDVLAGGHDAALNENGCSCERGGGL
jgi:hypothetical protein